MSTASALEMDIETAAEILMSMQYDRQPTPQMTSTPEQIGMTSISTKFTGRDMKNDRPTPSLLSALPPNLSLPSDIGPAQISGTRCSDEFFQRNRPKRFTCLACPKGVMVFPTVDELYEHLWYHDIRPSHTHSDSVTPHRTIPQGCATCPFCTSPKLAFASPQSLAAHMLKMHGLRSSRYP
ncbi:hypothetical protein CALVIDRAFT_541649 [Calocera viscosa TUFC12733]|uniref:Uncharacterized protein n=1 Tax=Calocera viscosa (strain TUFC12733) TaxID=1330018 RepID=A0A167HGZ0_CALVF|nr:hypothetical protein CALVIDRAFT_541649 [Calocera viscosa TUFC12733]